MQSLDAQLRADFLVAETNIRKGFALKLCGNTKQRKN